MPVTARRDWPKKPPGLRRKSADRGCFLRRFWCAETVAKRFARTAIPSACIGAGRSVPIALLERTKFGPHVMRDAERPARPSRSRTGPARRNRRLICANALPLLPGGQGSQVQILSRPRKTRSGQCRSGFSGSVSNSHWASSVPRGLTVVGPEFRTSGDLTRACAGSVGLCRWSAG
jgi:hypothetical protein